MSKVFISYSHIDTSIANDLASILKELNIDYFLDSKDINWGNSISTMVQGGLDKCSAILVIVSPASLDSHWVPYEIGHVSALRKLILPYLTHPSLKVPQYISSLSYVTNTKEVKDYFANKFAKEVNNALQSRTPLASSKEKITFDETQVEYLLEIGKPQNQGIVDDSIDKKTGRNAAKCREVIELFQGLDLMQYSGHSYSLTSKGWKILDQLWEREVLESLVNKKVVNLIDLSVYVGLSDGDLEKEELIRHIISLENKGWVEQQKAEDSIKISITEEGISQLKYFKVDLSDFENPF